MHDLFRILLFGYDRADTVSANWIWRAGSGGGLSVGLVSVKYSDLSEGRCDACEIVLVGTEADINALGIDVDQEIRFFVQGVSDATTTLRYYGYIKEVGRGKGTHDRMKRTLIIGGLMEQLDEILAYRYYNDCFIGMSTGPYGGLIENLLTDVIIGESNVNVANSFTEIDTVPTLISTTDFPDVPVAEAIARLAVTEGDVIYGVDHQAKLYFKKRPATYAHTFQIGQDGVKVVQLNKSNYNVRNTYIVRCKTLMAGGELAFEVVDDRLASNPDIRIRMEAVNTPEYSDDTGATDYGEALIMQNRDPSEPICLELADFSDKMWAYENIQLKNELGVSFGSFPIKALHWDITPMRCGLSVELGEIEPDLSKKARLLLRLQRIGAAREFSNNIELIGERYSWLIVTRRAYANQFQTRNFWGMPTDDDASLDLPEFGETEAHPFPVFEDGISAVCGVPVPKDEDGNNISYTIIESKLIEVGVERDEIALGLDNEFRTIRWTQNEFSKYCRKDDIGRCVSYMSKTDYIYPMYWVEVGATPYPDTVVWYEAAMCPLTDLEIQFTGLENLSASAPNDRFHLYWCVGTNASGSYPPLENCCRMQFDNNAGTLEFKTYQEYLGATTLKYSDSVPMSDISGVWLFRAHIDRCSIDPTRTRVIITYWNTATETWLKLFDTGDIQYAQRSRSFWGARWERDAGYLTAMDIRIHHCHFSGGEPLMAVSKDEGENWQNCVQDVLVDISALPAVGTSLKMRMSLTHYHLVKGWCIAFK
jgi:hypothetical protein